MIASVAATAALAAGLIGYAHLTRVTTPPPGPPQPPPSASALPARVKAAAALPASRPVRLEIPKIGVRTPLMTLGKNPDQTIEVPPLTRADTAGWYRLGPTPGSRGAAVIVGHVDTTTGPAVFYRLGRLRAGDKVRVFRRDGRPAIFVIDAVESVRKDRFPTAKVYADPGYPAIRLITCGGAFDANSGHYERNIIAYGHLTR
ncbi:class F sortase [Thermopolyspora sp. NPDC052614]|uniref:class F sortase n=1 Tax=Thermopolyspora sp. NPDC052614 TaxID=3155682 RepID=UPI0034234840